MLMPAKVPSALRAWLRERWAHGPAAAQPTSDPTGRRRALAITVTAALGLFVSVVLAAVFADADARLDNARFAEQARDYQLSVGAALARVTDVVAMEQAYFRSSDAPVSRDEFTRFAKSARETLSLGMRDTTWAPRVTAARRAAFEQAVRDEGMEEFEIRELGPAGGLVRAADRDEYFPLLYVDPASLAPKLIGFDMGSEAERRRAISRAWRSGQPAVTSPIALSLAHPNEPPGFIIFGPVYGAGFRDSGVLRGVVMAILESRELVEHALGDKRADQDLDVYLYDPVAPAGDRLIYWHASRARVGLAAVPAEAAMRGQPHAEARLRVADRDWGILLARPPAGDAGRLGGRGLAALLLGLAVTAGVVAYLAGTLRHALRLEALTAELRRTGDDLLRKGREIAHLAQHDALTGLPNRVALRERLRLALSRPRLGPPLCVMCLDLDRFKAVNDAFGHPVGDALLGLVAARLRGCLRAEDTVARIGGDEFVVLPERQEPASVEALARRLIEAIGQPYAIRDHLVSVRLSIGIAFPADGSADDDLLLRNADFALYRAKQAGRGTWRVFEPTMEAAASARRALEANLRQAVADMSFELHFQPVVRLSDRRICGCEALLRWNCPGRGPVSPAEFVPLAEECGLIVPIGDWVLQTACREAARWPAQVRIAVNISPAQFVSPALVASVERALAAARLEPARLELEITETLLLQDSRELLAKLHALKALGVSIAMDDFGTGYSSLSYLCKFPFDKLKIDQSFVRDLPTNPECRAIVHAVAGLCRTIGVTTIAEGVETVEHLRGVLAEGCDEAQGYLFSRPVPAAQVAVLIANSEPRVAAA
jgi:diguanylate cyclase (GGDEF)-like protein